MKTNREPNPFAVALEALNAKHPAIKEMQFDNRPDDNLSGCKVGWTFLNADRTADIAAVVAYWQERAQLEVSFGYDFGYSWPGSTMTWPDGRIRITTC